MWINSLHLLGALLLPHIVSSYFLPNLLAPTWRKTNSGVSLTNGFPCDQASPAAFSAVGTDNKLSHNVPKSFEAQDRNDLSKETNVVDGRLVDVSLHSRSKREKKASNGKRPAATAGDTRIAELTFLANIVRREPKLMTWEQYREIFSSGGTMQLPRDQVVQVQMEAKNDYEDGGATAGVAARVDAYVLPEGRKWFSFFDTDKQTGAPAPNVLVVRASSELDIALREDTLKHLCDEMSVVWMGHPGIGKSIEVSYILMKLFQHLGRDGWPSRVAYRVGPRIYIFQLGSDNNTVTCTDTDGSNLEKVAQFCYRLENRHDLVLVLELMEGEKDPRVAGITTFTVVSAEGGEDQLKTISKGMYLKQMLRGPHTPDELALLFQITFLADPAASLSIAGLSPDTTEVAFMGEMKRRMSIIGPLAREVSSSIRFEMYQDKQKTRSSALQFLLRDMLALSAENLPGDAKYFVAMHPVPRATNEEGYGRTHEFRFLSDAVAAQVGAFAQTKEQVKALEEFYLNAQRR